MQPKISLEWLLLIIGVVVVFSSAVIFFVNDRQIPRNLIDGTSVGSTQSIAVPEQVSSGLPVRLKIPKINVDAAVEYVGRLPDGTMDIPKSPDDVAWFEQGTRPGENGSAVIAGHYGWKNGKAAAFDNVYTLRKGDKVYVEDNKGVVTTFVVRESRTYDRNADASDVFGSNDERSHLNLITCEGVWDETKTSYSDRLVVFTDKD